MTRLSYLPAVFACVLLLSACGGGEADIGESLTAARDYVAAGEYNAAMIELKNVLQQDKNSAEARWLLGKSYLETGYELSADKELRRAQRLGWSGDEVVPALARALLAQAEYVQVRELSTEGLSPGAQAELMAVQALAENAQGEDGAADLLMERATELAPDSQRVRLSRARLLASREDREAALVLLDELLAENEELREAWMIKGDIAVVERDTDGAIAAYDRVVTIDDKNVVARLRKALLALQQGRLDIAQVESERLMALAPSAPGSNYVKGVLQFSEQDYTGAVDSLTIAEPAYTVYPLVLFYLGSAHAMVGNFDQAAEYADRFLALSPNNIAGRKLAANLALRRADYKEVQRLLRPVLNVAPDDVDSLNMMSNALIRDGRNEEGIAMLARVAELEPESAKAQMRLGAGLMLQGESDDAVSRIESALQMDPEFQQADILLILNHVRNENFDEAIAAAESYVGRNPGSVTPHNLLGRVQLAAGNEPAAREAFNTAMRIDPANAGANNSLAALDLAAGDRASARKRYEQVLATYPDDLSTLLQLARLEMMEGRDGATVSTLLRAISAHPEVLAPRVLLGQHYVANGQADEVPGLLVSLDAVQRRAPAVQRLLTAAYLASGQYEQARQSIAPLLVDNDDNPALFHYAAQAAAGTGDQQEAREFLERALEIDPEFLPSLLSLTRLDLAEDQTDTYPESLKKLLVLAPETPEVKQLQAILAYRAGDAAKAAELAGQAFALEQTEFNLLRWVNYLKPAGQAERAGALLKAWLEEHPDSTRARLALAIAFGLDGESSASIAQYQEILELNPDDFVALNNLAWELRKTDTTAALGYARRAVELQPGSASALDTLAVVEYLSGDLKAAQRSIRKAVELAPEEPSMKYHNAMIEAARGQKMQARDMLKELLSRDTEFPERKDAEALLATLN